MGNKSWAFWRWCDIRTNGEIYLTRLTLLKTPWFGLKLHWIRKPDPDRDLHDHPWWFASLVLRGGYDELVNEYPWDTSMTKRKAVRWFNYKNTVSGHRIIAVKPKTLTLVFTGPKAKSWGFYNDETGDFTDWRNYHGAES